MLNAIPDGGEIALHAKSVIWCYAKKSGRKLVGGLHETPEFYRAHFNTYSTKSGYKAVEIRQGTDNFKTEAQYTDNSEFRSDVTNSSLPKPSFHGTHNDIGEFTFQWASVPNSTNSDNDKLSNWAYKVAQEGELADNSRAPHPVPPVIPQTKPIFLNHLYQRKRYYVPKRSRLDSI